MIFAWARMQIENQFRKLINCFVTKSKCHTVYKLDSASHLLSRTRCILFPRKLKKRAPIFLSTKSESWMNLPPAKLLNSFLSILPGDIRKIKGELLFQEKTTRLLTAMSRSWIEELYLNARKRIQVSHKVKNHSQTYPPPSSQTIRFPLN